MHVDPSKRGKRNRVRGAELQREVVKLAKEHHLEAFNRDRGGAQHEQGDIEIRGWPNPKFFGCKRKDEIAQYLHPEKEEQGVFIREDYGELMVIIPAVMLMRLLLSEKILLDKIHKDSFGVGLVNKEELE